MFGTQRRALIRETEDNGTLEIIYIAPHGNPQERDKGFDNSREYNVQQAS